MALEAVEAEPRRDDILGFTERAPVAMQMSNNDRTWWGYGRQVEKAMQEAEKKGYFVAGVFGVDQGSLKALWGYKRAQILRFHALQRVIQVAQGAQPYDMAYHTGLTNENLIDIKPERNSYYSSDELKSQRNALVAKQMKLSRQLTAKHRKDIRELDASMTVECKRVLETKSTTNRYGGDTTTYEWYLVLVKRK